MSGKYYWLEQLYVIVEPSGLKMLWEAWRMKPNEGEETQREVEEELARLVRLQWGMRTDDEDQCFIGEDPHQVWTPSLRSRRVSTARRRRTSTMTILSLISVNQTENISISERNLGSERSVSRFFEFSPTPSPWLSSLSGGTGKNVYCMY